MTTAHTPEDAGVHPDPLRAVRCVPFTALAGGLFVPTAHGARVIGWSGLNNTAAAALVQLFDGGSGSNGAPLWSQTLAASTADGRMFGAPGVSVVSGLWVFTSASVTGSVLVSEAPPLA
jgi:hypothetical protein